MVILAVDSTARPFECDIGEKPNILAGLEISTGQLFRRGPRHPLEPLRGVCRMSIKAEKSASASRIAAPSRSNCWTVDATGIGVPVS
nr:hypothetical protein [Paraburkholderia sp. UCT2]